MQRESPRAHQLLSMDYSSSMIMTPFNYHEWKSNIGIMLRNNGLYIFNLALTNKPNFIVEKAKWNNRLDESYGFLCVSISPSLLFHIDGFATPNQVWTKLEYFFGVQNEIRVHQLENELFSLSPISFNSLEGFFTKFK